MTKEENPLKKFLMDEGLKGKKFGEKIGISRETISKICNGYKVGIIHARAIEAFTRGRVKAIDICSHPEDVKRLYLMKK